MSLVTTLLDLRISQEQGVQKETKDNGGFQTEHQGRSGSIFSQHAGTSDVELQKCLGECVENKGCHLTDPVFKKWMLNLKCFELKIILVINLLKKIVHFSFYFNLKIVRFFCLTLYLHFLQIQQNSCYLVSDNPALLIVQHLRKVVYSTFYWKKEKLHQWNKQISGTCSEKPPRPFVGQSTAVLSPEPASPSLSTWAMKTPANTEEDPDDS